MSHTVVTFGEIMLRLAPPSLERLLDSPRVARLLVRGGELTIVFREKGLAATRVGDCDTFSAPQSAVA